MSNTEEDLTIIDNSKQDWEEKSTVSLSNNLKNNCNYFDKALGIEVS